jgi:hypothetical protein
VTYVIDYWARDEEEVIDKFDPFFHIKGGRGRYRIGLIDDHALLNRTLEPLGSLKGRKGTSFKITLLFQRVI